jgi:hypothetical protein
MWDGGYRRAILEIFNALQEDTLEVGESFLIAARG